jgi:hypothetical protein
MHANTALIVLDEQELAAVDGGGPFGDALRWLAGKAAEVAVDCLAKSLDDVISGISAGYANAT